MTELTLAKDLPPLRAAAKRRARVAERDRLLDRLVEPAGRDAAALVAESRQAVAEADAAIDAAGDPSAIDAAERAAVSAADRKPTR